MSQCRVRCSVPCCILPFYILHYLFFLHTAWSKMEYVNDYNIWFSNLYIVLFDCFLYSNYSGGYGKQLMIKTLQAWHKMPNHPLIIPHKSYLMTQRALKWSNLSNEQFMELDCTAVDVRWPAIFAPYICGTHDETFRPDLPAPNILSV